MTVLGVTIVAMYAVYLALNIGMQFGLHWIRHCQRYDPLRIIVRWTLFAPRPILSDYHLVARGPVWVERQPPRIRPVWAALWNPRGRVDRSLRNCADQAIVRLRRDGCRAVQLDASYLAMLNVATATARAESWGTVRFAVVATTFDAPTYPDLMLASATHASD